MKVDDRSAISEHFICQLWEKNYFSSFPLYSVNKEKIEIIYLGTRNTDAGPDFKNAVIKIGEKIHNGDVEIHRAPEDWYLHGHHADPGYNNVILHLVIGKANESEAATRLNRQPVMAEIFFDIPEDQFPALAKKYQLQFPGYNARSKCVLSLKSQEAIVEVIDFFSRLRFQTKAERFKEQRLFCSWDQVLYIGIMEALGYSKNQAPFRKLANIVPFEALSREYSNAESKEQRFTTQAILLGAGGLLPSQDKSFDWKKIKDKDMLEYVPKLEAAWKQFSRRSGIEAMEKDEWLFFRLRPVNFPTRRIAGASLVFEQFYDQGFLVKLLKMVEGLKNNHAKLIKEFIRIFSCKTTGYWESHYRLESEDAAYQNKKSSTLVGTDRAKEIVSNIVLPVLFSYSEEIEDAQLKITIIQLYEKFPKATMNSLVKEVSSVLFPDNPAVKEIIASTARQQGLIHIYKLFCRRRECSRCQKEWEKILD